MRRSLFIAALCLAGWLALPDATVAQIGDLSTLQEQRGVLGQSTDSLMSVRVRLVALRDSLSTRSDSLWRLDPESTELLRTRSASRTLVARLRVIEQHLDSLSQATDSLHADLRDSYDWEIARLLRLLSEEGWDEGLYLNLLVFQEERQELGDAIRASQHRIDDDHQLGISADDGPEELRQKIEFAQDRIVAAQLAQREIARQQQMVERRILVMRRFAEDLARLHKAEENLLRPPGGGDRPRQERPRGGEVSPFTGEMRIEALGQSADVVVPAADTVVAEPLEAQWLLEGQKLRAQAQQWREVEAVLQERVAVFHEHLARMLEGADAEEAVTPEDGLDAASGR